MSIMPDRKGTFIRLLVVVVLVGVLIAISIIKSNVSAYREDIGLKALEAQYRTTIDSLQELVGHSDSAGTDSSLAGDLLLQTQLNLLLVNQLQDSTRFYTDSLKRTEDYYQELVDSINSYYASRMGGDESIALGNITLSGSDVVKLISEYDSLVADIPEKTPPRERIKAISQITSRLTGKYTSSPPKKRK